MNCASGWRPGARETTTKDFEELFGFLNAGHGKAIVVSGYARAWAGRAFGHYGAQPVSFLGRSEFIKNKQTVGRLEDLVDIDELL
jgi:hypothetical protein